MKCWYHEDHVLEWIRQPFYHQILASATTCSLDSYIDHMLWLSSSSLTVSEVEDDQPSWHQSFCPSSHQTPQNSSQVLRHLHSSCESRVLSCKEICIKVSFPKSRKAVSNNADLMAKLADPPIMAVKTALQKISTLRRFPLFRIYLLESGSKV